GSHRGFGFGGILAAPAHPVVIGAPGSFRQNAVAYRMAEIASSRCALLAMTASTKPPTSLRAKRSNLASHVCADVRFSDFDIILLRTLLNRAGALPRGASRRTVVPNCRFRTLRPSKRGSRSAELRSRRPP